MKREKKELDNCSVITPFRSESKPLTVLYDKIGSVEDEDGLDITEKYPNLNLQNVKPKYPYGTHHSKVMVFVYEDDSVRVVISTSNLIGGDWINRSQGLWVSPRCPKSASDSGTDSPTNFKRDLTSYLESYEMGSHLRPFVGMVTNSILLCWLFAIMDSFKKSVIVIESFWSQMQHKS